MKTCIILRGAIHNDQKVEATQMLISCLMDGKVWYSSSLFGGRRIVKCGTAASCLGAEKEPVLLHTAAQMNPGAPGKVRMMSGMCRSIWFGYLCIAASTIPYQTQTT